MADSDGMIEGFWRCSCACNVPGFFVHLDNTIERHWRSLKHLIPKYRNQDVTSLMVEMMKICHAKVLTKDFEGLVDTLVDEPMFNLISGRGIYPTTEELGHPDAVRSRRLTAKNMFETIEINGIDSVLLTKRFELRYNGGRIVARTNCLKYLRPSSCRSTASTQLYRTCLLLRDSCA